LRLKPGEGTKRPLGDSRKGAAHRPRPVELLHVFVASSHPGAIDEEPVPLAHANPNDVPTLGAFSCEGKKQQAPAAAEGPVLCGVRPARLQEKGQASRANLAIEIS
jgi:hypothetical protein